MITRQVRFHDEDSWHGGILVKDAHDGDFIICGCCGSIFPLDDVDNPDFDIVLSREWIDISPDILADWIDADDNAP